jgi:hypothetical protein
MGLVRTVRRLVQREREGRKELIMYFDQNRYVLWLFFF